MNLQRLLLLLVALTAAAPLASAQIGIYGALSASRVDNPGTSLASLLDATNTSYWSTGVSLGAYYDIYHLGPISLGPDLRYAHISSAKTALVGARIALHPPILPFKPYLELSGGATSTSSIYNIAATHPVYQIAGGLDYRLIPHVDFRVIEIGSGHLGTSANAAQTASSTLTTVSTGLVVRF